jgi:hypothetical protein
MKMLRRLPKILRFIPGTAQDVRAYFLTLQYWLAGSEAEHRHMVHFLVDRYADGPRRGLRGAKTHEPVEYPELGIYYHPQLAAAPGMSDDAAAIAAGRQCRRARHRGHAAAALLPAGRQHRALRRRDHRAGGARPACDTASSPPAWIRPPAIEKFFCQVNAARWTPWSR